MKHLIMIDGSTIASEKYIYDKSVQLRMEGFKNAHEDEVEIQLDKVLNGASDISIIGMYIKDDLLIPQPLT